LAECPQCHSSIEITENNFGTLYNCPYCQAVFFIGWDGLPEIAPQVFPPQPSTQSTVVQPVPQELQAQVPVYEPQMEPVFPSAESMNEPAPEPAPDFQPLETPIDTMMPPSDFQGGVEFKPFESNDTYSPGIDPGPAVGVDSSPDFADVVEFGNKPDLKSPLTYTVMIQGIEIADVRKKFKDAISDSRFGWDVEVVLQQLKDGAITFHDLSPAKATALINRIRFLPIRISWRQNVLS
jgi:hypothetical protein